MESLIPLLQKIFHQLAVTYSGFVNEQCLLQWKRCWHSFCELYQVPEEYSWQYGG